ncbi:MAG: ATP-binding protein, partial [Planctomycetes bacterium]|nr:ATP-binding protein [Planctomycetota bacterium]
MEAVLLIGIPASGKSSFYAERFASTHLRINLDM